MLDIGANVGYFSLLAANFFDEVYSFEPGKKTIPRLYNNIQINNFKNIQVMECAISNKKTQLILHENSINQGGNTLEGFSDQYKKSQNNEGRWVEYVVDTDTVDNVFRKFSKKIDMIKIDVEGHELPVIEGAINTIHTHKPLIYVEIFTRPVFDKIQQLLSFEYISYDPILNMPIRLDSTNWEFQNILFVPRSVLK
jgi:FkbM family methyltransferase